MKLREVIHAWHCLSGRVNISLQPRNFMLKYHSMDKTTRYFCRSPTAPSKNRCNNNFIFRYPKSFQLLWKNMDLQYIWIDFWGEREGEREAVLSNDFNCIKNTITSKIYSRYLLNHYKNNWDNMAIWHRTDFYTTKETFVLHTEMYASKSETNK